MEAIQQAVASNKVAPPAHGGNGAGVPPAAIPVQSRT